MNYSELTRREAHDILLNHVEVNRTEVEDLDERGEIIEPVDVLYWMDAFGDLTLAVQAQGLPKDLPDAVVEEITNYDVRDGWRGTVEQRECPTCRKTLYEFDWNHDNIYLDEYGGTHKHVELLNDHAGLYWNVHGDEPVMCESCSNHQGEVFGRWGSDFRHGVRVFFGEQNDYSRFTYNNGVIRWDFMWDSSHRTNVTDLYNFRDGADEMIPGRDVAAAFAGSYPDTQEILDRLGWMEFNPRDLNIKTPGVKRTYKHVKDILNQWADLECQETRTDPTHPDLDFTYVIESGKTAYFPEENEDEFLYHLTDQVLFEAGATDQLREHRQREIEV